MENSGKVIWVVEDDASTQRLIAFHLQQHGLSPGLFGNAEKALASLQAGQLPDLILLDMLLPGMSGVDLIRLIKQNETWKKIPVVVVTVLSRNDAPTADLDDETTKAYWVNKPFDTNELMQTIQGILSTVR